MACATALLAVLAYVRAQLGGAAAHAKSRHAARRRHRRAPATASALAAGCACVKMGSRESVAAHVHAAQSGAADTALATMVPQLWAMGYQWPNYGY